MVCQDEEKEKGGSSWRIKALRTESPYLSKIKQHNQTCGLLQYDTPLLLLLIYIYKHMPARA